MTKCRLKNSAIFLLLSIAAITPVSANADYRLLQAIFRQIEAVYPLPYDKQKLIHKGIASLREVSAIPQDAFENCLASGKADNGILPADLALALTCSGVASLEEEQREVAIDAVAKAITGELDLQSSYLGPSDFAHLTQMMNGDNGSLGISARKTDAGIEIVATTRGAPARENGISVGDVITAIDGKAVNDLGTAIALMRGPPGSAIVLELLSQDGKKREVSLVREMIDPNAAYLAAETQAHALILDVDAIENDTPEMIKKHLSDDKQRAKLIILDLRGNQGGLLEQSYYVADLFLQQAEMGSIRGKSESDVTRFPAKKGDIADGKPLIVLTDKITAAGAEIIAAALQDNKRALVVGSKTAGAGTVQMLYPLAEDRAIKLTSSVIVRADGRKLMEAPVIPDCVVADEAADIYQIASKLSVEGMSACPIPQP